MIGHPTFLLGSPTTGVKEPHTCQGTSHPHQRTPRLQTFCALGGCHPQAQEPWPLPRDWPFRLSPPFSGSYC